jgi:hypothetical protein
VGLPWDWIQVYRRSFVYVSSCVYNFSSFFWIDGLSTRAFELTDTILNQVRKQKVWWTFDRLVRGM